jgi:hypothetical protein
LLLELKTIPFLEYWETGNLKEFIDRHIHQLFLLVNNFQMENILLEKFKNTKMKTERELLMLNIEKERGFSTLIMSY